VLQRTAKPLSGGSCGVGCGSGLIDAEAALAALATPVEPNFALSLSPATLSLEVGESVSTEVLISRSGGFSGEVAFSIAGLPGGLSASFTPSSTAGSASRLTLTASAGAEGDYTLEVQGVGGGVSRTVPLSVFVRGDDPPEPAVDIEGTVVVACYFVNNTCDESRSGLTEILQGGLSAPYVISDLGPGSYFMVAIKDVDEDGAIDDVRDYSGVYLENGQQVAVIPPATGIDIAMTPGFGTQAQRDAALRFWSEHR
jgi:serine protease